jgi:hypothetical protein
LEITPPSTSISAPPPTKISPDVLVKYFSLAKTTTVFDVVSMFVSA